MLKDKISPPQAMAANDSHIHRFDGLPHLECDKAPSKRHLSSSVSKLVGSLTDQAWYELGCGPGHFGATSDRSVIVQQLTTVLQYHLRDLICNSEDYPPDKKLDLLTNVDHRQLQQQQLSKGLHDCLTRYVERIVSLYRDVFFHSIEHAAHVTISMNKLVSMLSGRREDTALTTTDEASEAAYSNDSDATDRGSDRSRRSSMGHVYCRPPQSQSRGQSSRFNVGTYQSDSIPSSLGSRSYARNSGRSVAGMDDDAGSLTMSEMGPSPTPLQSNNDEDGTSGYGIGTDPVLRFALVFAALVHDVGHQGVPNNTLVEEEDPLAICHNDVSVAEQNSLQVAFTLLNTPEFALLKRAIMPTQSYRRRFRKLVIDLVLATDISNPERMQVNQAKWKEAFSCRVPTHINDNSGIDGHAPKDGDDVAEIDSGVMVTDKSATFELRRRHTMHDVTVHVKETTKRIGLRQSLQLSGKIIDTYEPTSEGQYLMQQHATMGLLMNVADVSHTVQSFETFVKWNRRLYKEMLYAYHNDRIPDDPTIGWYRNQINFFDCYIIPKLTERLAQCGAFGHKAAMFTYFALDNRRRWIEEGQCITDSMVQSVARELLALTAIPQDDDELHI